MATGTTGELFTDEMVPRDKVEVRVQRMLGGSPLSCGSHSPGKLDGGKVPVRRSLRNGLLAGGLSVGRLHLGFGAGHVLAH